MNMRRNYKKHIVIGAFTVLILLILFGTGKKSKGVEIYVRPATRGTITESIPANGKIQPVTEIKISPDVSGEIIELNVKEGDRVKAGDLLIKIKQDLYISAVNRAEASLNSIKAQYLQQKAQLSQTELSFNRNKILYEQKAISESEYENSLSQYQIATEQLNAAQYNVKSAEAALNEAQENLYKTTIYAPMTGIVSKLDVEKGERVVGTSQMAGTEMLRIANLNEMEVLVDVNENDIIRLSLLDTAIIEVDAYPNRKFKGVVTQIANSAKNSGTAVSLDQVTNFEVNVSIFPDSYRDLIEISPIPFRPGMSASVSIQTERRENVFVVPLQSVTVRADLADSTSTGELNEYIFIYNPAMSAVKPLKIVTGIQDMSNIEVISGLSDSLQIVTGPYNAISRTLKNGTQVKIISEKGEN